MFDDLKQVVSIVLSTRTPADIVWLLAAQDRREHVLRRGYGLPIRITPVWRGSVVIFVAGQFGNDFR